MRLSMQSSIISGICCFLFILLQHQKFRIQKQKKYSEYVFESEEKHNGSFTALSLFNILEGFPILINKLAVICDISKFHSDYNGTYIFRNYLISIILELRIQICAGNHHVALKSRFGPFDLLGKI
jgi:hypothetical protein